jgi:putative hydrolase of HD superfamily
MDENFIDFYQMLNNLKYVYRFSESKHMKQESTAAHSWRLSVMAATVAKQLNLSLDCNHAVKIALMHDIAEAVTGDMDYRLFAGNETSKLQKKQREDAAMQKLIEKLPLESQKEILLLWEEYSEATTAEARYIKALDKIEAILQLIESGHMNMTSPEIIAVCADVHIRKIPELEPLLHIVKLKLKQEFEKGHIEWKQEYNYCLE